VNFHSVVVGTSDEPDMHGRQENNNGGAAGNVIANVILQPDGAPTTVFEGGKFYVKQKFKVEGSSMFGDAYSEAIASPHTPWATFFDGASGSLSVGYGTQVEVWGVTY
jgi:hypothetical protein